MTAAAVHEPDFIRTFTAEVAALVAAEHVGDPMGELVVWLQMALRREASVGELYGAANLDRRLERVTGPPDLVALLQLTVANIWAQERGHASYLEAVLSAVARPSNLWLRLAARLDGLFGAVEGQVLAGRTSPSSLQRARAGLVLAVGRQVQDVPEFVSSLSSLSFGQFCRLNAELELTAVHGYQRIAALLRELDGGDASLRTDTTMSLDVNRMIRDERFHHRAFLAMADWFVGNTVRVAPTVESCAARLAAIRADAYGLGNHIRKHAP